MKRILSLILILMLLVSLPMQTLGAHVSETEAAETLAALGLLRGTGNGFELERGATRAEAAVMLLRLLGCETAAQSETDPCPFDDGGWAAPQLTYAWKNGLVTGRSTAHFGSADLVGSRDYVTMLLRALGYSDDFTWQESLAFADRIGLCHGEYTAGGVFLRGDLALLSYTALTLPVNGTGHTLAECLYRSGVLSGSALRATRLLSALETNKPVYSAMELHERCASAVFLAEMYRDEASYQKDKPDARGSGFFITGDGVALMCYHELDGMAFARITTMDGNRYEVTGVLSYDPFWDFAVVRVNRTDQDGNTVRFFPYLDLGDSDALCSGETVFTLSNPLGLADSMTDGIVSNPHRIVDDPDYPCIQVSAPISSGSSGGVLLNCHGEAVGVIFAGFTRGENMNLAMPVNVLSSVRLTGSGVPLREVKQTENAKKAAALISVSVTELEMRSGEEVTIEVTHTAPCGTNLRFELYDISVAVCIWNPFITKHTVPLTIIAGDEGETDITIRFANAGFNEDASAVIHLTVRGTAEE